MRAPVIDLADRRFRANVIHLHRLGPRALYEFLAHLSARHMIRTDVRLASSYRALDPAVLAELGGDRWPG